MSQKRFVSPCAPPTAHQREILEILIEECSEVIQRATKMLRFGVNETQPGQPYDNEARLSHEVGDLLIVIGLATASGLAREADIDFGAENKKRQLAKYMQTSPDSVQ